MSPFRKDSLVLVAITALIFSQTWRTVVTDEGGMRLPKNVLPVSYDIQLLPIIEEGNFTTPGFVEIVVDCIETTSAISMNSADISIDESSIMVLETFRNLHRNP